MDEEIEGVGCSCARSSVKGCDRRSIRDGVAVVVASKEVFRRSMPMDGEDCRDEQVVAVVEEKQAH